MTDKRFRDLDSTASVNRQDIFAIEQSGNSRRISGSTLRTFIEAGGLATHLADTTPHGITTAMLALLTGNSTIADLLEALGILTTAGTPGTDYTITICDKFKIGIKTASVPTGATSVPYATDTNYSSWAVAVMAGDDSNNDVSTSLVSWTTSAAGIYSHASGSVNIVVVSFGE